MSKAQWIWYFGDYELYHSLKLHSRREEFGFEYPPFWSMKTPYPTVSFEKEYRSEKADIVRVVSRHKAYFEVDGVRHPVNADVEIPAGEHKVVVNTIAVSGLPSIYINSEYLVTDDTWTANNNTVGSSLPVGTWEVYDSPDSDPEEFPFLYETKTPVKSTKVSEGILYDFGREMYGIIRIEGVSPDANLRVIYGESPEEAIDPENALIRETVTGKDCYALAPRAFRYVCVGSDGKEPRSVTADYEYLPLEDKASFTCSRRIIKDIWDTCAYTLHLNSREFFLDGIKRDRWCWSGDAYQSFMANNYLFFDPEITKRTILALLGKPPYEQNVNTITDYSMLLIIGTYEYYYATGDKKFLESCYPRLRGLYEFMNGRTDAKGYICQVDGDWIFIDWADMDKGGPICAEQILFWKCRNSLADIADVVGAAKDAKRYRNEADDLRRSIMRDYWREERGVFVDCHTTGRENVTRHANIFAVLFGFVAERRARRILRTVMTDETVPPITTPYFTFFELCALCKSGKLTAAQKKIESYWGGMISLGATSIWEKFDPRAEWTGHLEMYGMKYGCSLCHAWGGGPIYLLGRYCLGVYPTSVGYKTYAVEPSLGLYRHIEGTVPLPDGGSVTVCMDREKCTVLSDRRGGVLRLKGKEYKIPKGRKVTVKL
ncbi:MAG: alpha-rhamnosidase [Ruminococcaceae bacterium]|nr:alpha-rhamnosidase [Oscillospiraceae bacterium]